MVEAYSGRPLEQAGKVPFVGRSAEIGLLDSVLDQLAEGRPAVVDVTGDAGIGKSRLLAQFCARARSRGLTVLCGQATEYERHSPLRPFADAFADLEPAAMHRFPALAELPPALRGTGETPAAPGTADRFGLYQATAALLGRLGHSLVVVLDDLHWADPASLELVDHLVRHPVPAPLLLVVSRRERQTPPVLNSALARGLGTGAVSRIVLGPLAERDCVKDLAGDLPQQQVSELYRASDGNPLYFLTLLHARHEGRPIPGPASAFATAKPARSGPPHGLPSALGSLLLDELAGLSSIERRILEATAVLGDHADTAMIGRLTALDHDQVIDSLRELMQRDLLRPGPDGRQMVLRHPLIRALIHENTDPWQREEFHRRAAAELASAGAPVIEQAHHVEQSVTYWDAQAAAVLVAAAEQSAATAPATSAHWFGAVLRLLPDTPDHLTARRELTLRRASALGVSGGLQESRDLLRQVMDMSALDRYDDIHTTAVTLRALMERLLGRHREAEALLRRELARSPGPSPSQAVRIGLELCSCALSACRFPEVRADIHRVLRTARSIGDRIGEVGALTLIAMGEAYEGDTATARTFATAAAAQADALTDTAHAELCELLCTLGWTEAFLEDYATAEEHLDRGLDIARATGQLYLVPSFLTAQAYVHLCTCRITTALELAEEAEPIARALGSGDLLAFTLAFQSQILLQARSPERQSALVVAEEATASAAGTNESWWAALAWCMLANAALDANDPQRASDILLRIGGGSDLHRLQPTVRPNYLEALTGAALAVGDTDAAAHWATRAQQEAEQLGLPAQRGAGLRSLALVAAHRGDSARAARLYTAAATHSARSGATLREAQSLLLAAPHAQAMGDGNDAADMWHRGSRLASEGGSRLLVALAERLRPAVFGPADKLESLSTRERQVAGLVAEGLTSPAIADRLYLSPRTVETHIARIYRKTGVSSRAALASIVTRDGRSYHPLPPMQQRAAHGRRLVGRDIEVDSVIGALADLKAGVGRAIALVGEPGIGKSSLLRTAAAHARDEGIPVLTGHGSSSALPTLPGGPGIGDPQEVMAHAVDRAAVMTVVDDLHDLAGDRIADIERLLATTTAGPVLCLLSYRQRQLSPALAAVLARASSAGFLEVWNLGPLSQEQARELLGDRPNLDEVHREAEGNPQYLQIMAADDRTAVHADTAILGELTGLDPGTLTVVQVAAVLGGQFHPELLAAVAGLELPTAVIALDSLARLDLIRPAEPAPQLSLRHPAVGKVVYKHLEPGRRTELHQRAEAELAKRAAPIAERAHHVARAADPRRPEHATTLIAAARGMIYTSPAVATGHLQAALSLLQEGGAHWYEAKVLLARTRLLTGDASEGRALLEALRSDIPGSPPDDATALADSSRIERRLGRYTEAGALARAGLAALTDDDSAAAAALHAELADYAYDVQDYETSRQHAETAAWLARGHGDRVGEANALGKAALGHLFTSDQPSALTTMAGAAELLDAVPDATLVANLEAAFQVGMAEGMLGLLVDSERHLTRGAVLSRRTGQTYIHPQMLTVLGNAQLRSGNLRGALTTLDEADHHVRRIGDLASEAVLMTLRAEALFWRDAPGDLEEATGTAERARAAVSSKVTSWAVAVRCANAEFILHTGDPARAGWLLLDAAGGDELPRITTWRRPRWCESLAQVAAAEGDQVSVDRWARLAEESVEQLPSAGRRGFALRARMRAHALHGDTDSALRCAQDAIADFAGSGDRIEAGRTLLAAAALALDAGRTDAVGGWLDRAAALADQCGSARMAAYAGDQRLRLASKDKTARTPGLLSALTASPASAPHDRRTR
ncbi:AAA family ATPase [Streptacidiphilus sp. EB103A]|uniref:AAA family ATPase n=1 Tax=Streptacidiphilus sp. EB103A TaxID=3156275 RepID=UPI0035190ECE